MKSESKLNRLAQVFDYISVLHQNGMILFSYQELLRVLANGPCLIFYLNPHTIYCETVLNMKCGIDIYFVYEGNSAVFFAKKFHKTDSITSLNIDDSGIVFDLLSDLLVRRKRILFIGGSECDAPKFSLKMKDLGFEIACIDGYRSESYEREIIGYDYVFLSMGSPLQEKTALSLSGKHNATSFLTCGGFVSQFATAKSNVYPKWIVKLRLRFLFRMVTSLVVAKRVIFEYSVVYLVWWQRLKRRGSS